MHDYLLSLLFGIVEGLTEFLPVSSTAHLRIALSLVGEDMHNPYWKMYHIVIQLGAILSVLVYFRLRIKDFLLSFPKGSGGDRTIFNHPVTLVLVAFVVTAGPVYLFKKIGVIDKNLENLWVMGWSLVVGGVIMWIVDVLFTRPRTLEMEQMSLPQATWIGAAQILSAVFPGTSRSMSTIAAGQVASMSRASALEFSFFLSMPTMIAATGKELLDAMQGETTGGQIAMTPHHWGVLAVGFVISFFVAWAVIAWFMGWVRKRGFVPFAIYRIVFGGFVLVWAYRGGI